MTLVRISGLQCFLSTLSDKTLTDAIQDYVRELGSCLLHLEACPDKQVGKRMTQLVNECQDLLNGTYEGLHSAMAKAIAGGNLEQAFAATAKLDGSFWHQILVSNFSSTLVSVELAIVTHLQCTR